MADEISIEQLMHRMPKAYLPEVAGDLDAVIQFQFTGAEAGDWIVTLKDGVCQVEQGISPNPTMTLKADSQDYKDIILGKLDPMAAFMQQKVKLTGNLNLALGLTKYFKLR
jgi:putative sterol carrier protein